MTRRDKWAKRPVVLRYFAWADKARECAKEAGGVPDAKYIDKLLIRVFIGMPKSWSKKKQELNNGTYHRNKPDLDNCEKSVCDSLWKDDSGIAHMDAIKFWSYNPRTEITIYVE